MGRPTRATRSSRKQGDAAAPGSVTERSDAAAGFTASVTPAALSAARRARGSAKDKLVGRRVSVRALDSPQFYEGVVLRFNYYREENRHYVRYDDGVEDWEDLSLRQIGVSWQLLPEENVHPEKDLSGASAPAKEPKAHIVHKVPSATSSKSSSRVSPSRHTSLSSQHAQPRTQGATPTKAGKKKLKQMNEKNPVTKTKLVYRRYKGKVIQPSELWHAVQNLGGLDAVNQSRSWQIVRTKMGLVHSTSSGASLKRAYTDYFIHPGHFQAAVGLSSNRVADRDEDGKKGDAIEGDGKIADIKMVGEVVNEERFDDKINKDQGKESEYESESEFELDSEESESESESDLDDDDKAGESNTPPTYNLSGTSTPRFSKPASKTSIDVLSAGKTQDELIALAYQMTKGLKILNLKKKAIKPAELLISVMSRGGVYTVRKKRDWQKVRADLNLEKSTSSGALLNKTFNYYFEGGPSAQLGTPSKRKKKPVGEGLRKKRARLVDVGLSFSLPDSSRDVGCAVEPQASSHHPFVGSAFSAALEYAFTPIVRPNCPGEHQTFGKGGNSADIDGIDIAQDFQSSPVTQQNGVMFKNVSPSISEGSASRQNCMDNSASAKSTSVSSASSAGSVALHPADVLGDNSMMTSWSPTPLWDISPTGNSLNTALFQGREYQHSTNNCKDDVGQSHLPAGDMATFLQDILLSELDPANERLS